MSDKIYSLDDGIQAAVGRATRDRAGSFAVYVDAEGSVYVRDAKASPPKDARLECIAQFWSEDDAGPTIQVRRSGASSQWIRP